MRREKMKKGYIFLMDGIFAVILLVIGLIIVSSNSREESTETPLALTLDNSLSLLSSAKIDEMCNSCNCSIKTLGALCASGNIMNSRQSLLDYMGELYSRDELGDANLLLKNISSEKDIFREKALFDAELLIDDVRIYPESPDPGFDLQKKKAKDLLASRRIIFGYYEDPITGKVTYWGPYEVKLEIWEKQ